jgi:hypothetical protein
MLRTECDESDSVMWYAEHLWRDDSVVIWRLIRNVTTLWRCDYCDDVTTVCGDVMTVWLCDNCDDVTTVWWCENSVVMWQLYGIVTTDCWCDTSVEMWRLYGDKMTVVLWWLWWCDNCEVMWQLSHDVAIDWWPSLSARLTFFNLISELRQNWGWLGLLEFSNVNAACSCCPLTACCPLTMWTGGRPVSV